MTPHGRSCQSWKWAKFINGSFFFGTIRFSVSVARMAPFPLEQWSNLDTRQRKAIVGIANLKSACLLSFPVRLLSVVAAARALAKNCSIFIVIKNPISGQVMLNSLDWTKHKQFRHLYEYAQNIYVGQEKCLKSWNWPPGHLTRTVFGIRLDVPQNLLGVYCIAPCVL